MARLSKPLEFLAKAQSDPNLSLKVFQALEKGNATTAKQVMKIAQKAGYSFNQNELQNSIKRSVLKKFSTPVAKPAIGSGPGAPESACSRGCLSYTHSWHPDPIAMAAWKTKLLVKPKIKKKQA